MRSDHQQATDLLGHDRTTSNVPTEWSRTDNFVTNDGNVVPFELDGQPQRDGDLSDNIFLGLPPAQFAGRVDALRVYGIRELELRRDAGGLWGLNPFISLDLDS